MQLKFRIILNVEEDVFRDIVIDSNITLIEFSKIISSEFGFDSSEISTFHHSNENWEQLDEIKIYDFLNYWTFFIEVYELDESVKIDSYKCINSVGEVPKNPPSDIFDINSVKEDSDELDFDDTFID